MGKSHGVVPPNSRRWVGRENRFSIDGAHVRVTGNDVVSCITLGDICHAVEAGHPVQFPMWYLERRFVQAYAGLALHGKHRYFFSSGERVPEPTGLDREPLYSLYWLREYLRARPEAKNHLDSSVHAELEERFTALEPRPPAESLSRARKRDIFASPCSTLFLLDTFF